MMAWFSGLLVGIVCGLIALTIILRKTRRNRLRVQRLLTRLRANRSVLSFRARRAERLAEVGTLTGGLAHEIKNPLSTVLLNLQLLQEDLDPNDPTYNRIVSRLGTVSREASRLRDILDDFLKYAGKIEIRREPVNLNQLLEELADFFAPQAQLNHVQLRLKPHDKPLIASVDPRLIKQAVLNLMINALQAMPSGGELILSASESHSSDLAAIIDVIDTGPGIPADQAQKIFQAYYSTKKGGTGLGLAMTQRIVEEHGGQIQVQSEPGKGSDFRIKLPMNSETK
jgi:signal transduction histidine kinase